MGEWQIDSTGRKYRMIGEGCKEYECTVITTCGEVPYSQLESLRKKDTEKIQTPEPAEKKYCPFKSRKRSLCKNDCAFWNESGCMGSDDTKNKKCPFNQLLCGEECKLYDEGCTLVKKGAKHE